MKKLDLWGDCPYSPTHRFKNEVCLGCGLKKPKLPDLIDSTRKERTTLEDRINRISESLRKRSIVKCAWDIDLVPSNAYDAYGYSSSSSKANRQQPPSAPLKGEKKRNLRRLTRAAKLYNFYEANWPTIKTYLDQTFSTQTTLLNVQNHVEAFVHTLVCYGCTITKNQIEELTAAYTYHLYDLPERRIAEEPNSLFPQVTRKTLRKWAKTVKGFEEALG